MKRLKKIVQTILSVPAIRVILTRINLVLLRFGSLNRLTSLIYSFFFFFIFSREQYANVRGRYLYYRNLNRPLVTRSQLRRNVHRLEKGIIMRPRRDYFAADYIGETVDVYKKAIEQYLGGASPIDIEELMWAHHVLDEYFGIVKTGQSKIDKARKRFVGIGFNPEPHPDNTRRVPYASEQRKEAGISYEDFLAMCMYRRSVRWYLPKKVPREKVDKALLAARQSPSACNRLPYEFRIFDEPELVKRAADLPMGAAGYSHNIPMIAVVVGKLEYYFSPRDRHAIYIDSALAAMPFMLALQTQGISSSVINWPDFEPLEIKMQRLLKLDTSERPIMLIAIGYADPKGQIPYSQKKELNTIRSYNRT